jgi:hypothetical protein
MINILSQPIIHVRSRISSTKPSITFLSLPRTQGKMRPQEHSLPSTEGNLAAGAKVDNERDQSAVLPDAADGSQREPNMSCSPPASNVQQRVCSPTPTLTPGSPRCRFRSQSGFKSLYVATICSSLNIAMEHLHLRCIALTYSSTRRRWIENLRRVSHYINAPVYELDPRMHPSLEA